MTKGVAQLLGPFLGGRDAYAKLFRAPEVSALSESDQFRAWLTLTFLGLDPSEYGINDEAVPRHFDVERLRADLYTTRDSNPEPADLGSEDELAARRTARSAVEVEQVAA